MSTRGQPYSALRWDVRQRMEFIESRIFWEGRINRSDLIGRFGISGVQATTDLSRYAELAPQNLFYDRSEKTYLAAETFVPCLTQPKAEDLLTYMAHRDSGTFKEPIPSESIPSECLPTPQRIVDIQILRKVVSAIRKKESIEIRYQSMSKPDPAWRWISPHAFANDGMRWHVRAYCFIDNTFKDFLLARILDLRKERPGIVFSEEDEGWNTWVQAVVTPHPGLSAGQKKVMEADYGMVEGRLVVEIRSALLPYFLQRYGLIKEKKKPEEQQIVLANRSEICAESLGRLDHIVDVHVDIESL